MQFDAHILALRLKKLRNKRNISQEHLAGMADLSTVYISYAMQKGKAGIILNHRHPPVKNRLPGNRQAAYCLLYFHHL